MLRPIAFAALLGTSVCLAASMALAAPDTKIVAAAPSPPPPDSSHTPKQPVPVAAKAKHAAPTPSGMSAWRRAYIAKHGHAPAVSKPMPKSAAVAAESGPHKAAPVHRYRKCV